MARGTKRKRGVGDASSCSKPPPKRDSPVRRDLLEQCYSNVSTLREYILSRLPSSSRLRRRKIASLGQREAPSEVELKLGHLLDTTLVCSHQSHQSGIQDSTWEQWLSFSQKGDESYVTVSDGIAASIYSQSEIVDFVIWLLFSREKRPSGWPKHLLCDGFRRRAREGDQRGTNIPGLFCLYPNSHAKALREAPWPQLLALLGQSGERVMIDLLLDCSIFVTVEAGFQNYYQLSGNPISETAIFGSGAIASQRLQSEARRPSDITLVRSRIFYAKPALTPKGLIQPGFKHIHVLNRCALVSQSMTSGGSQEPPAPDSLRQRNEANTTKVMMYIFPRQFGLHNVFTSTVDTTRTAQKHQDYTLREEEIAARMSGTKGDGSSSSSRLPKLPKRLRGAARQLTERLQVLHGRCSYIEILKHHCPSPLDHPRQDQAVTRRRDHASMERCHPPSGAIVRQSQLRIRSHKASRRPPSTGSQASSLLPQVGSLVELATPSSRVSAFCQAVLRKIVPSNFWGDGDTRHHNTTVFLRKVDHFIKLRRFETLSLHEISQDLRITDIDWLRPPGLQDQKCSRTDTNKRHEIFHEFLYYIFDSLLIPLIRSNFYVTESNTHRYEVFYFRHDVWRSVAEASMTGLKSNMLEEVKMDEATRILDSRRLGFSQIRLLPKGNKLRPIINLRKRAPTKTSSKLLGPSINSVLAPIHTLLKLEKDINPLRLGATMFAVSDIYTRLKSFKEGLGTSRQKLYFAKVDVKAAFDTIPQEAAVKLMASVPSQEQYTITKHVEVKPGERAVMGSGKAASKPIRRWHATATTDGLPQSFLDRLEAQLGSRRKNTVFVDGAMQRTHDAEVLLDLLAEHVERNIIKVGKKYYRQKRGIPQGSVLSSFLCNYFYADLETQHLGFLQTPDCLLLRLIDDFLLITLDKSKAVRFVETMHAGLPDYGVEVSPAKTLANFDMSLGDGAARRLDEGLDFPYCGTLINCATLEISKDHERDKGIGISNSLTVEFSRAPGQNFVRKTLNAFKIQSHLMFFDTAHNSLAKVLVSLRGAFRETAAKMWAYARCLPRPKRPDSGLIVRTISQVVTVAFLLLTGKSRKMRYKEYTCDVRKEQVTLIAYSAFLEVLSRKQSRYEGVITWLRQESAKLGS